ncbi:MAG: lamin tail domain-containing protein [Bacteroidales bacterium]|nr:lamin tail domain-containing protein [Bacteroidales bacterium]
MKNSRWWIPKAWFLFIMMMAWTGLTGQVARYDVVISEIMADPTPAIGLPAAEYVELHNRTDSACLLVGCTLQLGNTVKALPAISIEGDGYAIVVAEKYREEFSDLGIDLFTLSSLSITDGGQRLTLYDNTGSVMHSVAFRKQWHKDGVKQDGGWSLEMIDERQPWLDEEGWASSVDPSGGTPGRANSHSPLPPDRDPPELTRVTMTDSQTLRIWFSEPISDELPFTTDIFKVSPAMAISSVKEVPPTFQALDLRLAATPHSGQTYHIEICGELCDCSHNLIPLGTGIPWGTSHHPDQNDLVINEILTHPFDGCDADFVELYNRSSHIIDLKDVKIGSGGDVLPDKAAVALSSGMQVMPGAYAVLCKNRKATLHQYHCPTPHALVQCDSLPAYANASGVVFVTDYGLQVVDRFAYTEEMHYSKLLSSEGVSLERLDPHWPTQDNDNWHSAAESVGFATPGYANSQRGSDLEGSELSVTPEVFSPDNDGYDDFTFIRLQLPEPENRVSIQIFDLNGNAICHLANNMLCGTEAQFRWDGEDDRKRQVPSGLYVVDVRWWRSDKRPGHKRKVVAVNN